jgi:hypothetical protein
LFIIGGKIVSVFGVAVDMFAKTVAKVSTLEATPCLTTTNYICNDFEILGKLSFLTCLPHVDIGWESNKAGWESEVAGGAALSTRSLGGRHNFTASAGEGGRADLTPESTLLFFDFGTGRLDQRKNRILSGRGFLGGVDLGITFERMEGVGGVRLAGGAA